MTATAFVGATVVDVIGQRCVPGLAVVVSDGRISAVGRPEEAVPQDASIRDVSGCWILPGLVDMHCHLTGHPAEHVPLELMVANGVTTVRDPGGPITQQRLLRDLVQSGQRTGPRILIAGELLDGNPPVWPTMSIMVDGPGRGAAAVRHLAAQGVDCVKIYNHVREEVLAEIVDAARELGLPVIGHVPRRMSMARAVEVGMSCLEHIRITGKDFLPPGEAEALDLLPVGEREPRLWSLIDLEAPWVAALIEILVRHDVTLDPTLLVDDVIYGDGLAGQVEHRDNGYLTEEARRQWAAEPVPEIMQMPPSLARLGRETNAKRREFVLRCWSAGVRVTTGTDGAGLGRLLPGFGVHHEISLLRAAGLPSFAALRAATIDAAAALGLEGEIGSVSAGKRADLGLWTADPLVTHLRPSDLAAVVMSGDIHDGSLLREPSPPLADAADPPGSTGAPG